jgi:hypothetical protein
VVEFLNSDCVIQFRRMTVCELGIPRPKASDGCGVSVDRQTVLVHRNNTELL